MTDRTGNTCKRFLYLLLTVVVLLQACSKDKDGSDPIPEIIPETLVYNDTMVDNSLRLNQLQYLSSHNSYRKHTDPVIYKFLKNFEGLIPYNLIEWEYDHDDIYTQLEKYGVRHVELDFYGDKEGGRFYNRAGYLWTARDPASNIEVLKQPGLKVMHIPDVDFETHYHTFVEALTDIKRWSDKYPDHLPVYIMLEAKTETVGDYLSFLDFVKAEPWDAENIAAIEQEILRVFPREKIIKPDDVRGARSTLREAVVEDSWPTIGQSRGKVMFLLDGEGFSKIYKGSSLSLEGKLIFTNASGPAQPDAAFIKRNDPDTIDVETLVQQGFLVRSMIGGVYQARSGDYSKFEMAKAKGVHFLSTDYYKPDERAGKDGWTDFTIKLENHSYRLNPVTK